MKDISTLVYIAIILISIFGGIFGKKKKPKALPSNQGNKPQQQPRPQSKSLEEILKEISAGFEQQQAPQKKAEPVYEPDPEPLTYQLEDTTVEIIDTEDEDVLAYDYDEDHHVHGKGFDEIASADRMNEVVEGFVVDDWKKAIIYSEILKRPEY